MNQQNSTFEMAVFGARVQQIRKARRLTQEDVADRIGCSLSYISKLENGKASCNLSRLLDLADALKCAAAELIFGVNRGSRAYLEAEVERMLGDLTSRDKELVCILMASMIKRSKEGNADHAIS